MLEYVIFNQKEFHNMINKEFVVTAVGVETIKDGIGYLYEVVSRQPHSCIAYSIGNLKTIVSDDDNKLASLKNTLSTYMFILKEPIIKENVPAILKGSITPYNICNNTINESLKHDVRLYLSSIPNRKIINPIIRLQNSVK